MGGRWTRAELADMAEGKTVYVCSPSSHDLPIPYWLGVAAASVGELTASERMTNRLHRDQPLIADAWLLALEQPDTVVEMLYRTRVAGRDGWWHERAEVLNLQAHDDVRGIVVFTQVLGPAEGDLDDTTDHEFEDTWTAAPWMLYSLNESGEILAIDGLVEELIGWPADTVVGRQALDLVHPDKVGDAIELWLALTGAPGTSRSAPVLVVARDGSERWVETTMCHRLCGDGTSEFVVHTRDLTADRTRDRLAQEREEHVVRLEAELAALAALRPASVGPPRRAVHDTVTGLLNREALEDRLADALTHDRSGTLVVFLDLDEFGTVNDTHGHLAGDEVLEIVADRLRQAVRPGDPVCRYGADEFVILCHDAADGAAVAMQRRIEDVLTEPVLFGAGMWTPSASIGMARPLADEDLTEVIRRAELTMMDVKRKRHPGGRTATV